MKFPPLTVRSLQSLARVIFGGAEKSHVAVLCQGIAAQQKMIANSLVADAILDCSKRGGIILDVFAGSGTTLMQPKRPDGGATALKSIAITPISLSAGSMRCRASGSARRIQT
jgi:hypothetical protein